MSLLDRLRKRAPEPAPAKDLEDGVAPTTDITPLLALGAVMAELNEPLAGEQQPAEESASRERVAALSQRAQSSRSLRRA